MDQNLRYAGADEGHGRIGLRIIIDVAEVYGSEPAKQKGIPVG